MRSAFACMILLGLVALCGLALSCQTEPSQTERELLAELQILKAERASRDYLGELQKAVEGWRKAMNASLAKNNHELGATRMESQKQVKTMAASLDAMAETLAQTLAQTLAEQKASQSRSHAELEKALAEIGKTREELEEDRVQVGKTLEAIQVEREALSVLREEAKQEQEALELERKRNKVALDSAMERGRDALTKQRQLDVRARKGLADKLDKLAMTSAGLAGQLENAIGEQAVKFDKAVAKQASQLAELLLVLDGYREGTQAVDSGLASVRAKMVELEQSIGKSQIADTSARTKAMERELASISKTLTELQAMNAKSRDPKERVRLEDKIGALARVIEGERKAIALEREQGRQDRQDLQARLDALAAVMEKSFARLEKQNQKDRQARAAEAAARRAPPKAPGNTTRKKVPAGKQSKRSEVERRQKSALPSKEARLGAMNDAEPFWQNPFIAIPGAFLLLVLLFFLLRRSPDEVGMDLREAPGQSESEALEAELGSVLAHPAEDEEAGSRRAATPADTPEDTTAEKDLEGTQDERRMPTPRQVLGESLGQNASQTAMPRPRCLSLRIPGDELTEGAEELLHERLARDPRILVEPRPRLERRGDGSLSARFYSVGGLPETEVEALSRSLRSLVANR